MQIIWLIILIISVLLYIFIAGLILPQTFFQKRVRGIVDRGLINYKERNGRTIVYEPIREYRKYISQYILSERRGKRVMLVKLNEGITYINYDVLLYDSKNRIYKVITIKENIKKTGYSRVRLPAQTAYAAPVINSVNNVEINQEENDKKTPKKKLFLFLAVNGYLVILEIFIVKLCFANLFGDVFNTAFFASADSIAITFIVGVVASVAIMTVMVIAIVSGRRKSQ